MTRTEKTWLIRSAIKCNIWKYTSEYPLHFTLEKIDNLIHYKHTLEWNDETRQTVEQLPTYNSCKTSLYHIKDLSRQQNIHLQPHTVFIDYEIATNNAATTVFPWWPSIGVSSTTHNASGARSKNVDYRLTTKKTTTLPNWFDEQLYCP